METKRKSHIKRIRWVCVGTTVGITLLSLQGLATNAVIYQNFALGLAFFGLLTITLLLSLVVNLED